MESQANQVSARDQERLDSEKRATVRAESLATSEPGNMLPEFSTHCPLLDEKDTAGNVVRIGLKKSLGMFKDVAHGTDENDDRHLRMHLEYPKDEDGNVVRPWHASGKLEGEKSDGSVVLEASLLNEIPRGFICEVLAITEQGMELKFRK